MSRRSRRGREPEEQGNSEAREYVKRVRSKEKEKESNALN